MFYYFYLFVSRNVDNQNCLFTIERLRVERRMIEERKANERNLGIRQVLVRFV